MPNGVLPEAIEIAEPIQSQYEVAAQVLERAVQFGCQDANVLYMLAMAHKRQGKILEARNALRKIQRPDANVLLQMGLLSLDEQQLAQAEEEFARAAEMEPNSYEVCHNLLLTRLTLGKVEDCLALIPKAIELSARCAGDTTQDERRFLLVLQALLQACQKGNGSAREVPLLAELTPADEQRLLKVVRSLGQLDTVHILLKTLTEARPRSGPVREAHLEAVLVKAKDLIDRCAWTEAELLLRPLSREKSGSRPTQIALLNLLGCCACMTQDFDSAIKHYQRRDQAHPQRLPAAPESCPHL